MKLIRSSLFFERRLQVLVVPRDDALLEVDAFVGAVRRTMAAVDVAHPLHLLAQPAQRVVHLARLTRGDVRVLVAGDVEERGRDAVGPQDGGVFQVPLRVFPEGPADAILALFGGMRVAHAEPRSEEHTSELQSLAYLVCRLLLEKKKKTNILVPPRITEARASRRAAVRERT